MMVGSERRAQLELGADRVLRKTRGRGALGNGRAGERALIVTPPDQDEEVLEVIRSGMMRRQIEKSVDVVSELSVTGQDLDCFELLNGAEGWREVLWRVENARLLGFDYSLDDTIQVRAKSRLRDWLVGTNADYDAIYVGNSGRPQYQNSLGDHAHCFRDNWIYVADHDLIGEAASFPDEIQWLVEKKVLELLPRVAEVRISDREGSQVTFTVTEDEAAHWAREAHLGGHLFMYPAANPKVFGGEGSLEGGRPVRHIFPDANGVVTGCSNHFGFFPNLRLTIEHGVVVNIEGGGRFGDLLRELRDKTSDAHYPGFPHKGYMYLMELALGTHPKLGMRRSNLFGTYLGFPNVWERSQAGVFHWGFGAESPNEDFLSYARQNGLPDAHGFHVHTYFNTYEVRLRDSSSRVKVIDSGRLTALDDPEIIEAASNYGDPRDLLADTWRPKIPGINWPGDYERDYARNPAPWIWAELIGQLPTTSGVR